MSADSYSLRVTIDALFKEDLETLRRLLSHKVPTGDLAAVLREAVRCGIEKHGKRRGAVAPSRKVGAKERGPQGVPAVPPAAAAATSQVARSGRSAAPGLGSAMKGERTASRNESPQNQPASEDETKAAGKHRGSRAPIPAAARREVWARDGGQCAWRGDGGRRCESRWQLEFDHVVPVALGGPSTALNLRLTCRVHNGLHAEQVFGPEHMARFRRGTPLPGEITTASGGAR